MFHGHDVGRLHNNHEERGDTNAPDGEFFDGIRSSRFTRAANNTHNAPYRHSGKRTLHRATDSAAEHE